MAAPWSTEQVQRAHVPLDRGRLGMDSAPSNKDGLRDAPALPPEEACMRSLDDASARELARPAESSHGSGAGGAGAGCSFTSWLPGFARAYPGREHRATSQATAAPTRSALRVAE